MTYLRLKHKVKVNLAHLTLHTAFRYHPTVPKFELTGVRALAMNFIINEHQIGGVAVLCPQGRLTGCGGRGALREAIDRPFINGYHKILLNLANVSEIDVSCMEVLSDIHVELNRKGIQIRIVNVSMRVRDRMSAKERSVIDEDDYEFEADTLEASCARCVFDCPYNPRNDGAWE